MHARSPAVSPFLAKVRAACLAVATVATVATVAALLAALGCSGSGSSGGGAPAGGGPAPGTDPPAGTPGGGDPGSGDPGGGDAPGDEEPDKGVVTVIASDPEPFERDVESDRLVTIRFSHAVRPESLTADTIFLKSDLTGRLATSVEATLDGGTTVVIGSERPFLAGEIITVHVLASVEPADDLLEFEGEVFRFRAAASGTPARGRRLVYSALGSVADVLTGDIDLDGIADAAYTTENGTTVDLILGQADGRFAPDLRIDVQQAVLSLALADADDDGDLDVLVGTHDRARLYVSQAVEDGAPGGPVRFAVGPEAATGSAVRQAAIEDLDHRGLPDVVLATDEGIEVRPGGLARSPVQVLGDSLESRTNLVLADLNLDGDVDLAFGSRRLGALTVYLSSPAAPTPFAAPEHVELGSEAEQVAVADVAGDGFPEVVVLTLDGASLLGGALRLVTRTASGLEAGPPFGPPSEGAAAGAVLDAGRFALGDLDGDGALDIVLASVVLGKAVALFNGGGAVPFATAPVDLLSLPEPSSVRVTDLAADGILDVLSASAGEIHALLPVEAEPPPPPPPAEDVYRLSIDPVEAHKGSDEEVNFLVRLTNPQPLEGYTVVIGYDPEAIEPLRATIDGTATGDRNPEFVSFGVREESRIMTYGVLFDFLPPIENVELPAGEDQLLFRVAFTLRPAAPIGESSLEFLNNAGTPPISNAVIVDGESVTPEGAPGAITVIGEPEPPPPVDANRLELGQISLAPGETGDIAVLATATEEVDGFTTICAFDGSALEIVELTLEGSATESVGAELTIPRIDPVAGRWNFTVVFDFLPPFDRQALPPGERHLLYTVRVRALETAAAGTYPLAFQNGVGTPPQNNIFVFSGQSAFPSLVDGAVTVGSGEPLPTFLRGDFDGDLKINITDGVAISNFLFLQGSPPECFDAADTDDSGRVDLTDTVFVLNYIAAIGPPPPPPFPEPGVDPTPDELDC